MKKIQVVIMMVMIPLSMNAQFADSDNVFQKSEDGMYQSQQMSDPGTGGGIGDDDPLPAPIDDYIPFLALAGAAIAAYSVRKRFTVNAE